jgi:hypothetical protein
MSKEILILIIICFCLMLGMGVISYAGTVKDTANIQEQIKVHLEKVKIKNPQKYQEMIEKTGGNPADCTDCHNEGQNGNIRQMKGMNSKSSSKK